jgi:hypothetical protein
MNKPKKYVRITNKILQHYPNWKSIINESGEIMEETKASIRVHILSNGKRHLELKYSIPKDCVVEIPKKEMVIDAFNSEDNKND